jgi:hypothetical protein
MLNHIEGLPAGVIGFEISGKLQTSDYRDILQPALHEAAAAGEVRIVIVMPEFDGFSAGAFWEDLKIGVEHWRAWKRVALVTDIGWMAQATKWFGWMIPGEVRQFGMAQRDEAIAWAAG